MANRPVYNFNAGPAVLPKPVMEQAQAEFLDFRGCGYGLMEASHRSAEFEPVIAEAEADIRKLMGIGDEYAVLFLQGGASLQFAMVPMNLHIPGKKMQYANTGSWTESAIKEAKLFGEVDLVCDGKAINYTAIGEVADWEINPDASYVYLCSNNTIFGTEYHEFPLTGNVPLIADMSSDILSRPVDVNLFGMIFAGAQKNLGPAGVTLVIVRKDLAQRVAPTVPTMLRYTTHIDKGSMFNTPPTFSIYMLGLVAKWALAQGGLEVIEARNAEKSEMLYECIDSSRLYVGTVAAADRSRMNVTFRLTNEALEPVFIKQATAAGLVGLKGHRSVGGCRASLYNAMPVEGVEALVSFMQEFERKNG
ncbi:MAG: 3-phosphoserine/phosphohydroxythreonine transaminase [Lentisphaeria bacterium]|jgi:phosphoserine aminotransferase|nr:3-phosphoserine/phosphohydroxythreonine transaminase [Lentisphaeria bacterium]